MHCEYYNNILKYFEGKNSNVATYKLDIHWNVFFLNPNGTTYKLDNYKKKKYTSAYVKWKFLCLKLIWFRYFFTLKVSKYFIKNVFGITKLHFNLYSGKCLIHNEFENDMFKLEICSV